MRDEWPTQDRARNQDCDGACREGLYRDTPGDRIGACITRDGIGRASRHAHHEEPVSCSISGVPRGLVYTHPEGNPLKEKDLGDMTSHDYEDRVYIGRVRQWNEDEGWGVIESSSFDDAIWAHFSSIDPASHRNKAGGFRLLRAGDRVSFTAEQAEQDDFHWRTKWILSEEDGESEEPNT